VFPNPGIPGGVHQNLFARGMGDQKAFHRQINSALLSLEKPGERPRILAEFSVGDRRVDPDFSAAKDLNGKIIHKLKPRTRFLLNGFFKARMSSRIFPLFSFGVSIASLFRKTRKGRQIVAIGSIRKEKNV